ncbi:eCIS core domain-containing protein [Portibacter lacus]|uniref:eCIS core domain-containing protein n=1 Tax=Portibacter lacus TaxID=1099794 RepID=A0AA37SND4_9BACT|nr:DUF4157 domain-containing protein [Portibacter lacus]GLR16684.1 hypothetical protein GCM10007940_12990 [Portibacter lacus]
MEKNQDKSPDSSVTRSVAHELEQSEVIYATAYAKPPILFESSDPTHTIDSRKTEEVIEEKPQNEITPEPVQEKVAPLSNTDLTPAPKKKKEDDEEEIKDSISTEIIFADAPLEPPSDEESGENGAAGGGTSGVGDDENPVQKKSSEASSIENGATENTIPNQVMAKMETTLNANFSNVKINTNSSKATEVGALAYTQGDSIDFAPGQFNPNSNDGQELIGHELTHVVQQREGRVKPNKSVNGMSINDDAGLEQEADKLGTKAAHSTAPIQRKTSPNNTNYDSSLIQRSVDTESPIQTLHEAQSYFSTHFSVGSVRQGTIEDQAAKIYRYRGSNRDLTQDRILEMLREANWEPWILPDNDPKWQAIANSLQNFSSNFNSLPPISEIVFFKVDYNLSEGTVVPVRTGASYSAGHLLIHEDFSTASSNLRQATSRSVEGGDSSLQEVQNDEQRNDYVESIITHELGHGLVEQSFASDHEFGNNFNRAVGWINGQLYDIQNAEVAAAIQNSTAPPENAKITRQNWNSSSIREQPISLYSISNPAEDMAESIRAFTHNTVALRQRSPARYTFIQNNLSSQNPTGTQSDETAQGKFNTNRVIVQKKDPEENDDADDFPINEVEIPLPMDNDQKIKISLNPMAGAEFSYTAAKFPPGKGPNMMNKPSEGGWSKKMPPITIPYGPGGMIATAEVGAELSAGVKGSFSVGKFVIPPFREEGRQASLSGSADLTAKAEGEVGLGIYAGASIAHIAALGYLNITGSIGTSFGLSGSASWNPDGDMIEGVISLDVSMKVGVEASGGIKLTYYTPISDGTFAKFELTKAPLGTIEIPIKAGVDLISGQQVGSAEIKTEGINLSLPPFTKTGTITREEWEKTMGGSRSGGSGSPGYSYDEMHGQGGDQNNGNAGSGGNTGQYKLIEQNLNLVEVSNSQSIIPENTNEKSANNTINAPQQFKLNNQTIQLSDQEEENEVKEVPSTSIIKQATSKFAFDNNNYNVSGKLRDVIKQITQEVKTSRQKESGSITTVFSISTSPHLKDTARVDLIVIITKRMPIWTDLPNVKALANDKNEPDQAYYKKIVKSWTDFYSELDVHEEGHKAIDLVQYKDSHKGLIGKTVADIDSVLNHIETTAEEEHTKYHTNHGSHITITDVQRPYEVTVDKSDDDPDSVQYKFSKPDNSPDNAFHIDGSNVMQKMEDSFGTSFSNVNIHENSSKATEAGALAYAQGNDVHFAPGQFKPNTQSGQELIGHELTHVVQQREGRVKPTVQHKGMDVNDDPGLEKEADEMGAKVAQNNATQLKSNDSIKSNIHRSSSNGVIQNKVNPIQMIGGYDSMTPPTITPADHARVNARMATRNSENMADAIRTGDISSIRAITNFSSATTAQRMVFVDKILEQWWISPWDEVALERIWNSFGENIAEVGANEANNTRWDNCIERGMDPSNIRALGDLRDNFSSDVQETAKDYIRANILYAQDEMVRLGLRNSNTEESPTAEIEQRLRWEETQYLASETQRLIEAQRLLRQVHVGYRRWMTVDRGGSVSGSGVSHALFNPTLRPTYSTHPDTDEDPAKTWEETKVEWDKSVAAINAITSQSPAVYAAFSSGGDNLSNLSEDNPETARETASRLLTDLERNGQLTLPKIDSLDLDWRDLVPIHNQLYSGIKTGPSEVDWSNDFNKSVARDVIGDHETREFWIALGLGTASAAAFIVSELATGGFATGFWLGVGIGISGAQAISSWENWEDLDTANDSAASHESQLVEDGQVNAALLQAIVDSVFAFVDVATPGVRGAMALRSAARLETALMTRSAAHILENMGELTARESAEAIQRGIAELGVEETMRKTGRSVEELSDIIRSGSLGDEVAESLLQRLRQAEELGLGEAGDSTIRTIGSPMETSWATERSIEQALADMSTAISEGTISRDFASQLTSEAIERLGPTEVLRRCGWDNLVKTLPDGGPAGARLMEFRESIFADLQRFVREELEGDVVATGTRGNFSNDLDMSFTGANAASARQQAMEYIARRLGIENSPSVLDRVLLMGMFTDPRRIHAYDTLPAAMREEVARIQATNQEQLIWNRRVWEAVEHNNDEMAQSIRETMEDLGIPEFNYRPLSSGEIRRLSQRIDSLWGQLDTAIESGDQVAQRSLAEEIGNSQALINAAEEGGYFSGGGVRRFVTERPGETPFPRLPGGAEHGMLSAERLTALIDQLPKLDHSLLKLSGSTEDVIAGVRGIGKYGARVAEVAGEAGVENGAVWRILEENCLELKRAADSGGIARSMTAGDAEVVIRDATRAFQAIIESSDGIILQLRNGTTVQGVGTLASEIQRTTRNHVFLLRSIDWTTQNLNICARAIRTGVALVEIATDSATDALPIDSSDYEDGDDFVVQEKSRDQQNTNNPVQHKLASQKSNNPSNDIIQQKPAIPSDVNVHTNSSQASEMGALAFAQGSDIHFAPGQFKPDMQSGQELIGHELAHVQQQKEGRVQPTIHTKGNPVNDDPALELEADDFGKKFASQNTVQPKLNTDNLYLNHSGFSNAPIQKHEDESEEVDQERNPLEQLLGMAKETSDLNDFAHVNGIAVEEVTAAVRNASMGSILDNLKTATAYLVAKVAGHPAANYIASGQVKVKALTEAEMIEKTGVSASGFYASMNSTDGKIIADTLYLRNNIIISELSSRGLIIHELTHATDDANAETLDGQDSTTISQFDFEANGYRSQAKYIMDQIHAAEEGLAQTYCDEIEKVIIGSDGMVFVYSFYLEAQKNKAKYTPIILKILAEPFSDVSDETVLSNLEMDTFKIEMELYNALAAHPMYPDIDTTNVRVDGLKEHVVQPKMDPESKENPAKEVTQRKTFKPDAANIHQHKIAFQLKLENNQNSYKGTNNAIAFQINENNEKSKRQEDYAPFKV